MYRKAHLVLAALLLVLPSCIPARAQVEPAATRGNVHLGIGGGIDYWRGDWGPVDRFGPSAWATAEFWHGIGIIAEGHSMDFGDGVYGARYTYYVGEGGVTYNYHHWRNVTPFVKGEMGFGGLSFPHKPTATYTHDTRTTWAVGGGLEYKLWRRVWARADYTYDNFPNFYSPITGYHRTLNPAGFTLGFTYHLR
ncbi:MAG TPA: outer membrane beta-barrel protein [Terracidiphilus sp.]|nr:outer membrane beta-barrel protein [Terracidiphilus sp.]